jgi:hypothetical protein
MSDFEPIQAASKTPLKNTVMILALAVAILAFMVSITVADEPPVEFSKTDLKYISYVEEIFNLTEQVGDSIWPGLDYRQIPMLIYRPDSVAFLFNHPDPPPEFKKVEKLPAGLQGPIYACPGRYEDYTGQFWPAAIVNGHITFVCPYEEGQTWENRFFPFVVHEAFHTFQTLTFQDMGDSDEKLYPITLPENNALATLENLLLADAVDLLIDRDREELSRRARQFAIVREFRLRQAPPFVRRHERVTERLENTAFYVEKRCQGAGFLPGYTPTDFREYTEVEPYLARLEILQNLRKGILEHIRGVAITPVSMPRYRIYDNGAAIGYILDFLGIDWKRQAMSDSSFIFHRRLMQGLGISVGDEELKSEIEKIKEEFNYDEILSASRKKVEVYHQVTAALETQIRASGKIAYRIVMNVKGRFSQSKRTSKSVLYVDEGRKTLIEGVDQFLVESANASVTVRGMGLIFSRPPDGDTATVELFYDLMPDKIDIDGREQRLTDGNYASRDSLLLQLGDVLVIKGKSGTVSVKGDSITVNLD